MKGKIVYIAFDPFNGNHSIKDYLDWDGEFEEFSEDYSGNNYEKVPYKKYVIFEVEDDD